MAKTRKEPDSMVEFVRHRLDSEDLVTAAMIQPLPANIQPSQAFMDKLRAQLLDVTNASSSQTRAA